MNNITSAVVDHVGGWDRLRELAASSKADFGFAHYNDTVLFTTNHIDDLMALCAQEAGVYTVAQYIGTLVDLEPDEIERALLVDNGENRSIVYHAMAQVGLKSVVCSFNAGIEI